MKNITPNRWIADGDLRGQLYDVARAIGGLLVGYGLLTTNQLGLWLGLVGAILMVGALSLAKANKPKKAAAIEDVEDPAIQYPTRAARHEAEGEDL